VLEATFQYVDGIRKQGAGLVVLGVSCFGVSNGQLLQLIKISRHTMSPSRVAVKELINRSKHGLICVNFLQHKT